MPIQGSQSFVVRNGFDAKYTLQRSGRARLTNSLYSQICNLTATVPVDNKTEIGGKPLNLDTHIFSTLGINQQQQALSCSINRGGGTCSKLVARNSITESWLGFQTVGADFQKCSQKITKKVTFK